jgi:hypothetical protein
VMAYWWGQPPIVVLLRAAMAGRPYTFGCTNLVWTDGDFSAKPSSFLMISWLKTWETITTWGLRTCKLATPE